MTLKKCSQFVSRTSFPGSLFSASIVVALGTRFGPMFGKIRTKLLVIPAKEIPNIIGQKTVRLRNHITALQMTSKRNADRFP